MNWNDFPILSESFDLRGAIDRLLKGLQERYLSLISDPTGAGLANWPNGSTAWGYFVIGSVESDGVTVNADVDENDDPISWSTSRWAGYSDPESPWVPANYDLCVYTGDEDVCDRDPRKAIRVPITASGTNTLTLQKDLSNYVRGNVFSSLGSLAGKPAWILPRDNNDQEYPWWHQRWIPGFNDSAYLRGNPTSPSATSVTISQGSGARPIAEDELAGKSLFGVDNTGALRRVTISGNDASSGGAVLIEFPSQAFTFAATTAVYSSSSARYWPDDEDFPGLAQWYSGAWDDYFVHSASGGTATGRIAADNANVTLEQAFEVCAPDTLEAFDLPDAHVDFQDICEDADKWVNRRMPATIRGIQILTEALGPIYTKLRETYQGQNAIEALQPVGQFYENGFNHGSDTATVSGTSVTFDVSVPDEVEHWWWKLLNHRGWVITSGQNDATLPSGGTVTFSVDGSLDGKTLTLQYSWGYTRSINRRVRYVNGSTVWIPDSDGFGLVDPPTEEYPGTIEHHDASTSYSEYDDHGNLEDGFGTFANGDRAVFVGDNIQSVTIGQGVAVSTDADGAIADYWNHAAATDLPAALQAQHDASRNVTVSAGGSRWIQDSTKDWWDPLWHDDQPAMPTNAGTATSGGATTLVDTGKIDDPFWQRMQASGRVFIVRLLSGPNAGRRVPTASINAATGTITLASGYGLSSIGSGDTYSIPWPTSYEFNKWQRRKLILSDPSGNEYATRIIASDDEFLFFEEIGATPGAGWTGEILDPRVGRVVQFDGSYFNEVTSGDPRAVEPDKLTRYGRARRDDNLTAETFNEIWAMINMCKAFAFTPQYRSREDPEVEEFNSKEFGAIQAFDAHDPESCGLIRDAADDIGAVTDPIEETGVPRITAGTELGGAACAAGKANRYAYAFHELYSCRPFTMVVYVYPTINAGDPDDGAGVVGSCTTGTNGYKTNFIPFDDMVFRVYNSVGGGSGPGEIVVPVGDTSLADPEWGACPPPVTDCPDDPPDNNQYAAEVASNGWYAFDTKAVITFDYENYVEVP